VPTADPRHVLLTTANGRRCNGQLWDDDIVMGMRCCQSLSPLFGMGFVE
jgi:hypothetical protein